jgi:hypothetical protein
MLIMRSISVPLLPRSPSRIAPFLTPMIPENLVWSALSYTTWGDDSRLQTETNWVIWIVKDFGRAKEKEVRLCWGTGTAKTHSAGYDTRAA